MAVLIEAISVVVRREVIDSRFPGGWDEFVCEVPNNTLCTDGQLARVGFMSPEDVREFVMMLGMGGLTYLEDGKAIDIAVVDHQRGPMADVDWLEFAYLPFGDTGKKVAAAWLFDGPRMGHGIHVPGEDFNLATPEGWCFEESLSVKFSFVEKS